MPGRGWPGIFISKNSLENIWKLSSILVSLMYKLKDMIYNLTETLIDESNVEMLVNYDYDDDTQDGGVVIYSVELVIAGGGINITKSLSPVQYNAICKQLSPIELLAA